MPVLVRGLLITPALIMSVLIIIVPLAVMLVRRPALDDRSRWRYALAGQSVDDVHGLPSLDTLSKSLSWKSYRFLKAVA